jgi:hypothetical protein
VSGKNGEEHFEKKAKSGSDFSENGVDGLNGNPGQNSGNVIIKAKKIIQKELLNVITNGGNGARG